MKDYGVFCMAMAMPETLRDETNLDHWWDMASNLYESFLLSPYNKTSKSELDCIHDYMRDRQKCHEFYIENQRLKKEMKHRLDMVLDDIKAISVFIDDHKLTDLFKQSTDHAERCDTHISNIQVACDITSDECLSWRKYSEFSNWPK